MSFLFISSLLLFLLKFIYPKKYHIAMEWYLDSNESISWLRTYNILTYVLYVYILS